MALETEVMGGEQLGGLAGRLEALEESVLGPYGGRAKRTGAAMPARVGALEDALGL